MTDFYLAENRVRALMQERGLDYLQARNALRCEMQMRRFAEEDQRKRVEYAKRKLAEMIDEVK